jgi:hypothetical protein
MAGPANSWRLRLYVAGQTLKSLTAFSNLKQICETHLKGRCHENEQNQAFDQGV